MTRQQWTTPEQRAWLASRVQAFQDAQRSQSTSAFYTQVYADWAEKFDVPQPTADEVADAGSMEAAVREKRKALEKRLFQWFHNNTRPSALAGKEGVIPVKKPSKVPAPWQAYQKLFYDSKLKEIVDAEYEAYLKSVKDDQKPKTRISFQTEICRREYEKETNEVKAQVEELRRTLAGESSPNETEEQRVLKLKQGVERAQKTLVAYMKTLEDATGWSFCILGGGPNPQQGGKINRILYETTPEGDKGLTFAETLGQKDWKMLVSKWDDHLHEIFPESVRAKRSCSSTPTPAPEDRGNSGQDGKQDGEGKAKEERVIDVDDQQAGSKAHENANANKTKDSSSSSVSARNKKSEYELQKERNIARNKKIFEELFRDGVLNFGSNKATGSDERKTQGSDLPSMSTMPTQEPCTTQSSASAEDASPPSESSPTAAKTHLAITNDGPPGRLEALVPGSATAGEVMDVDKGEMPINTLATSNPEPPTSPSSNLPTSVEDRDTNASVARDCSPSAANLAAPAKDSSQATPVDNGTDVRMESIPLEQERPPADESPQSSTSPPADGHTDVPRAAQSHDTPLVPTIPSPRAASPSPSTVPLLACAQSDTEQAQQHASLLNNHAPDDHHSTTAVAFANPPLAEEIQPDLAPLAIAPSSEHLPPSLEPVTDSSPVSTPVDAAAAERKEPANTPSSPVAGHCDTLQRPTTPFPDSAAPPDASACQGSAAEPPSVREAPKPAVSCDLPTPLCDVATFSAAGYVTDEKNFTKLMEWSNAKGWKALVQGWLVFEQRYRNNGAIPTKPRPPEIALWMKNARKLNKVPKIVKLADFIISWRQWWLAMQPEWRANDPAWPPSRDIPAGRHWSKIAHSGPNGMFLLILSLGWWGKMVANGFGDLSEFETAVEDVFWVVTNIIGGLSDTSLKRALTEEVEDSSAKPHSKRARHSL